mmetsp:Transcript_25598/g.36726  ORF Transcript_25598/g.36726 Transcript_25598/m.36726 type:complete len:95 (+) Transcript_25598:394-678(+)
MMFQVDRLLYGSIPDVGSSKITTSLFPIRAMPSDNFLFCPPDNVLLFAFAFSANPTSRSIRCASDFTSRLGTPLNTAYICKCCNAVSSGKRMSC